MISVKIIASSSILKLCAGSPDNKQNTIVSKQENVLVVEAENSQSRSATETDGSVKSKNKSATEQVDNASGSKTEKEKSIQDPTFVEHSQTEKSINNLNEFSSYTAKLGKALDSLVDRITDTISTENVLQIENVYADLEDYIVTGKITEEVGKIMDSLNNDYRAATTALQRNVADIVGGLPFHIDEKFSLEDFNLPTFDLSSIFKPLSKDMPFSLDSIPYITKLADESSRVGQLSLSELLSILPDKFKAEDYIAEVNAGELILWKRKAWDKLPLDYAHGINWGASDFDQFEVSQNVYKGEATNDKKTAQPLKVTRVRDIVLVDTVISNEFNDNDSTRPPTVAGKIAVTPLKTALQKSKLGRKLAWLPTASECLNKLEYELINYVNIETENLKKLLPEIKGTWSRLAMIASNCEYFLEDKMKIALLKQVSLLEMFAGALHTYKMRTQSKAAKLNTKKIPKHLERMNKNITEKIKTINFSPEFSSELNDEIFNTNELCVKVLADNIIEWDLLFSGSLDYKINLDQSRDDQSQPASSSNTNDEQRAVDNQLVEVVIEEPQTSTVEPASDETSSNDDKSGDDLTSSSKSSVDENAEPLPDMGPKTRPINYFVRQAETAHKKKRTSPQA